MFFVPLILFLLSGASNLVLGKPLEYDYIIVGGGTAGSVVAARLSEDPSVSVALIEAGGSVFDNAAVKSIYGFCLACTAPTDWNYTIAAQRQLNNQTYVMHAGKCLGGTSAINGMVYLRPSAPEIDAWEAVGNTGWSWASVLPYYRKSEHLQIPSAAEQAEGATYVPSAHGFDGPVDIGYSLNLDIGDFGIALNASWQSLGLKWNVDPNAGSPRGLFLHPSEFNLQIDGGIREDAARAYYWPVANRSNLHTFTETTVLKVLLDDAQGRDSRSIATGVKAATPHGVKTFHARREVILSAGTYRTPTLLEVSGIGNPKILANLSIPVKVNLPGVGANMQDQFLSILYFNSTINSDTTITQTDAPLYAFVTAADIFGNDLAKIAAETRSNIPHYAELQANASHGATTASIEEEILKIRTDLIFEHNAPVGQLLLSSNLAVFIIMLPLSRGSVHASQIGPSHPIIDPNYFQIDFDLKVQAGLARFMRKLYSTPPLSNVTINELSPGLTAVPLNATDEQWMASFLVSGSTAYHGTGTVSMRSKRLGGVLDNEGLVYGIRNLRVVDASAIPFEANGNPTSTIYAMAERFSDLIKARWGSAHGGY